MVEIEAIIAKGLYFELAPIVVLGIFAGLAKFFQRDDDESKPNPTIRDFFLQHNCKYGCMCDCVCVFR